MSGPSHGAGERERLTADYAAQNGGGYSARLELDVPLSTPHAPLSPRSPRSPQEERQLRQTLRLVAAAVIFALLVATMIALLVATGVRCREVGGAGCLIPKAQVALDWGGQTLWPPKKLVSRIAFGSCAAYDIREQPLWEQGVIPSAPDAWVWLGDFFYADEPDFDCKPAENRNASQCQCAADWLRSPPYSCLAGDLDNARDKMVAQLSQPGYRAFLRYMCPAFDRAGAAAPPGDDLEACPRPILGTYDDHDYGVNNLDRRLPRKHLFKQIFLDGLGVAATSPRRAAHQGIHWQYSLNPGTRSQVDLFLLDERYDRSPLPCEVREQWCLRVGLSKAKSDPAHIWCDDFLRSGGEGQAGSCCKADRAIFWGWCQQAENRQDPLWDAACDAASPAFGTQALFVQPDGRLAPRNTSVAAQTEEDSSLCEMLGRHQRAWLEGALAASAARVKVVVSGSVLLGSTPLGEPGPDNGWEGRCSGDDWDCHRPAQLGLLHALQRHAGGACVVVLTGDYHYSDLKMARPGGGQPYSQALQTQAWRTPVYQVMASGLTNSTARPDAKCEGYRRESAGLRVEGDCGFVKVPSFGMLEFDWRAGTLALQVRKAEAPDGGAVLQQLTISLDTCLPL